MSRAWQVWFAIGSLLTAPALAFADGPGQFTTLPRPPMSAYEQPAAEELPLRPAKSSPAASNGIFNPTQLPSPPPSPYAPGTSPAPTNGGGAALGSPYIGGPPPTSPYVGGPPPASPNFGGPPDGAPALLQPDFDAPHRNRWLSIDLPTAWLIFPQFSQHLSAPVQVGNVTTTATLPSAPLDVTASPGLSIRADLPNMGVVELGYRFIASEGFGYVLGVDPMGAAYLRSRLDVQIAELTYARHDFQTHGGFLDLFDQDLRINDLQGPPTWILSWDIGARVANLYFDSHAIGATVDRQIVNYFIGGGAKVGLTLTRPIPALNMNLFSRAELGAMMGGVRQQFSETSFDQVTGNPTGFGYTARQQVQTVPTLAAQFGISSCGPHRLGEWQAGYQFEQWWAIGNLVGSSGDLITHAIFVRWVRNY